MELCSNLPNVDLHICCSRDILEGQLPDSVICRKGYVQHVLKDNDNEVLQTFFTKCDEFEVMCCGGRNAVNEALLTPKLQGKKVTKEIWGDNTYGMSC